MNTIFSCMLLLIFSNPVSLLAADDTDDAAGVVFIEGTLKIDDQGVYLESTDCLYQGKYYLGGVLDENTGDKKVDKANKKSNKKVAKQIKETASKVGKAENKTLTNQEIKGFFGAREGYLSPVKVISPMFEPIATGLSPACDLTLGAIYLLYLETQRIKALSRVISSKSVTSEDKMEESLKFYDSPQNGCKEIGMDELKIKSADIKSVLKEANAAVALNLVAIGAVLVNMPTIKAEINAASPLQKMAGMASIAQAVAFQARLLGDNKRLQDRIKEAEGIMEMVDKL
ncbi:MAG: hypothetical protein HOA52_03960 [Flavobacteriales bacterium]|nr:hypothetical protein [Flavobacteriales bacterium]